MIRPYIAAAIAVLAFSVSGASAQQAFLRNGLAPEGYVTVQSSISMSLPFDQSAAAGDQIQSAQKSFYEVAARSCSVVLDILADDCKITGITSNVDMQRLARDAVISVRGQIGLAIKLKSSLPAAKQP